MVSVGQKMARVGQKMAWSIKWPELVKKMARVGKQWPELIKLGGHGKNLLYLSPPLLSHTSPAIPAHLTNLVPSPFLIIFNYNYYYHYCSPFLHYCCRPYHTVSLGTHQHCLFRQNEKIYCLCEFPSAYLPENPPCCVNWGTG